MKTIKTYIQARRRKFSNNGGGLGSLVVVVVDFLNFFLVVLVVLVLSVSSAVKAVKSLLANKLIFCMRVFFDGGGTTPVLTSGVPSSDF